MKYVFGPYQRVAKELQPAWTFEDHAGILFAAFVLGLVLCVWRVGA
jgi:hypothetical protein